MEGKISSSGNIPSLPHDMDELVKELDSMPVEELREELKILLSEMDEDSFDGDLLEAYLDAIDRKSPQSQRTDTQAANELFLKRLKDSEQNGAKRRGFHGTLKIGLIAAVIAALLLASMAAAHAAGFDLFDRIARWTAETFGFATEETPDSTDAELPPQLQGIYEALEPYSIDTGFLPTYWPEGYEQSRVTATEEPESSIITGAFGENGNRIILSYIIFQSDKPEMSYNKDEEEYVPYIHNNIEYYVMTNEGGYLAVWYQSPVEGCISGVTSYEELIKILDSIGG